jgi:hypothetical protein
MKVAYLAALSLSASEGSPGATTTHVDPKTRDVLRRAAAMFMGDLSARELYAGENATEIKAKMEAIAPDYPGLIGGSLRNKALAILWAEQDHAVYEKKLLDLLNDVSMCVPFLFLQFHSYRNFEGTFGTSPSSLQHFCKISATENV